MKKFVAIVAIFGLLSGIFGSIFAMGHTQSEQRSCQTPLAHTPVCPASVLPLASHIISMYQSFTNGVVPVLAQEFVLMILFVGLVVLYGPLLRVRALRFFFLWRSRCRVGIKRARTQALAVWLALFTHSPSFN